MTVSPISGFFVSHRCRQSQEAARLSDDALLLEAPPQRLWQFELSDPLPIQIEMCLHRELLAQPGAPLDPNFLPRKEKRHQTSSGLHKIARGGTGRRQPKIQLALTSRVPIWDNCVQILDVATTGAQDVVCIEFIETCSHIANFRLYCVARSHIPLTQFFAAQY